MKRNFFSKRFLTKDCKQISISLLKKHHFFDGGVRGKTFSLGSDEKTAEKITLVVSTDEGKEFFRIQYNGRICYIARIVSTRCHYGGRRWLFNCPFIDNDHVCNRRVGILYFGKGNSFGCRHCLNLTYESQNEFHKFDRFFLNMDKGCLKVVRKFLTKDRIFRSVFSLLKNDEDYLNWKYRYLKKEIKKNTKKIDSKELIDLEAKYKAALEQLNERRRMIYKLMAEKLNEMIAGPD
jgi:hypothetical protein